MNNPIVRAKSILAKTMDDLINDLIAKDRVDSKRVGKEYLHPKVKLQLEMLRIQGQANLADASVDDLCDGRQLAKTKWFRMELTRLDVDQLAIDIY